MSLQLFINGVETPLIIEKFPAGETRLRIEDGALSSAPMAHVVFRYEGDQDLFNLLLLADAIRQKWRDARITLHCPYMPYARQDRVCNRGESLSIKVVADLINSMRFEKVTCIDLHSDVSAALIERLEHVSLIAAASQLGEFDKNSVVLVSPDAGANKKVFGYAKHWGFDRVLRADKTRDVRTGAITGTQVFTVNHVGKANFLILDDICDGGRTFVELALALRPYTDGEIWLYVSHGIFSKGLKPFEGVIDRVFVHNLMNTDLAVAAHPLLAKVQ